MISVDFGTCPEYAPFFGFMGIATSIIFSNLGSAYGTAKAGVGVASMGVMHPDKVMKNLLPVILAGVLGIYGLIVSIVIITAMPLNYSAYTGYAHLAAGLSIGFSALAAGLSIGIVGDAGARAVGQQPDLFASMLLMLIFGEALALYGLIIALILSQISRPC